MKIGIPKEIHPGEKRVAVTPNVTEQLKILGFSVCIEKGAGKGANFSDETYQEAGAENYSRCQGFMGKIGPGNESPWP